MSKYHQMTAIAYLMPTFAYFEKNENVPDSFLPTVQPCSWASNANHNIYNFHTLFPLLTRHTLLPPPYRSFVLSSLSLIQSLTFSSSLHLKPTLNGFGSVVKPVGIALHSSASRIGKSFLSLGGSIWNAVINRMNAVYSSRFAR